MEYIACHAHNEFIHLNEYEFVRAVAHGQWMYEKSHRDGRKDANGMVDGDSPCGLAEALGMASEMPTKMQGERKQKLGCLAETAVAKCLNLYWPGTTDNPDSPDVGARIEVRQVSQDHYGARVRGDDDDSMIVIPVVILWGNERTGPYRIPGWFPVDEAKRRADAEGWWMDPKDTRSGKPREEPFIAVPQSELRSLRELRLMCGKEVGEQSPWTLEAAHAEIAREAEKMKKREKALDAAAARVRKERDLLSRVMAKDTVCASPASSNTSPAEAAAGR